MKITNVDAKSIIVKSKLPDSDYVVNPYIGCQFACSYCYASFMGRFVGEEIHDWGNYLYVKNNAVELFTLDYQRIKKQNKSPTIFFSSVTDPYQPIEKQTQNIRKMLTILVQDNFQGVVGILTKSPLVIRDIDILKQLPNVEVGLTITTDDDNLTKLLEVNAPSYISRIHALKKLNLAGISTYAFIGPLLPHLRFTPKLLESLIIDIRNSGVNSVYVEHINLKKYIKNKLVQHLQNNAPDLLHLYMSATDKVHRDELTKIVSNLLTQYNISLKHNTVLIH